MADIPEDDLIEEVVPPATPDAIDDPCPAPGDLVEPAVDKILTQYRESPKFIGLLRAILNQVEEAAINVCRMPEFFDIESAIGDQLTLIGKRMGWPRCHCICEVQPVFGFVCEGFPSDYPIVGFCAEESTWAHCANTGFAEICLDDDEMYRKFLLARRYQILALFDRQNLQAAVQHMWGETALVLDDGAGRVILAPGRELNASERAVLQLVPRVLPVPPGIIQRFHFGTLPVFGFGEGWGGFCEPLYPEGLPLETEDGTDILAPDGSGGEPKLMTGALTRDAEWMCQEDVHPYDCPVPN
jgi:hypothetical protein